MIKTDCKFYEAEIGECIALNELYCEKGNKPCSFYKGFETKPKKEVKPDEIKISLDKGAKMPSRAYSFDAGYDLYARETKIVPARGSAEFDTGVHIDLPIGTVGFIKSKSGLNIKHGITSEGVIDCGYTGSIIVKLYNHSNTDYKVYEWDKISQLVILPVITPKLCVTDEFEETERGNNGFGSSGR